MRTEQGTANGTAPRPMSGETGGGNEVWLVGRLAACAEERELPSGDRLLSWRIVVDRPPPRRAAPEGVRLPSSDTLWCVAWPARLRRSVAAFQPGDVLEVRGALRQRYWRAGAALASRAEVEATAVRRVRKAA